MKTVVERQQETVARMKQSPCQCWEYHPKLGTDIYKQYMKEYFDWRKNKQSNVDKTWIFVWLMASQNCPYIREEAHIGE